MEGEEEHDGDAAKTVYGLKRSAEVAGVVAVGVDRDAVHEVREPDAPDERGAGAPDRVRPRPERPPARALALRAPLERDDADDQEDEDEQQRDVEAREHRRVPGRERREGRAAGDDEPDLVPVPDRPDRPQHRRALVVVAADERQQHPDAEVEALEHEVPGPEDGDQDEPEESRDPSVRHRRDARTRRPRRRPRAGRGARSGASGRSRRRRARRRGARTRRG